MMRYVTDEPRDPRERFSLYRLCDCPTCDGLGKGPWYESDVEAFTTPITEHDAPPAPKPIRCPDCRGEGRIRQEIAACESPEAVGVALVTLAREGEWQDAEGEPCAFGLLDREGEKGKKWLILPWSAYTPRHISEAGRTLARSRKQSDRKE